MDKKYTDIINKAWDHYNSNDKEAALELTNTLIDKYSHKIGGYYLRGIIEHDNDNYPKSVEYFKSALQNDNENKAGGYIHYWLGRNYNEKSNNDFLKEYKENPVYSYEMAKYSFEKSLEYDEYPDKVIYELVRTYKKDHYKSVNILKKGISKFPNNIDFIISYANSLAKINKKEDALNTLSSKATELNSSSLYFEAGLLFYKSDNFSNAILNFEKALELEANSNANTTSLVHFQIATTYFKNKDYINAYEHYKKSFDLIIDYNVENTEYLNKNFWMSVFGIIASKGILNEENDLENFILTLPFTKDYLEYLDFAEGVSLTSSISSIIYDLSNKTCIKTLNNINKTSKNNTILYKVSWLKAILFQNENDEENRLIALREVIKNDSLPDSFVFEQLSETYFHCLHDRVLNKKDYADILEKLNSDLSNEYLFRNNFDEYYITEIIDWLYTDKNYQAIIDFKKHFTSVQLDKSDSWFEIAFSYNTIGDKNNAQKSYEHYLNSNKQSTAALNNLANIYHEKKQIDSVEKAIKLYEKAIKIDGEKELYLKNLNNTKQTKEILLKERSKKDLLEKTFKRAIDLLKKEDYFSLETLHTFLLNLRKDDDFKDNEMAIQDDYFPSLMNTSLIKAEKLKNSWLSKNYLFLTDEYDEYNIPIYKINPYLEDAVNNQRKIITENDIPSKWLDGIAGISVSKLEEIQYFNSLEKINKVNKKFKPLIERDFNELVFNYIIGNIKSTIVLSGSFVELILTYYLEKRKDLIITYSNNGKRVSKNLYDSNLFDLISYIEERGYFGKDFFHLTNLSRVYRNFVHPGLELKNELNKGKSDICFISTMEIFKLI